VLQRIFQDYGATKITPIEQWRHERDLREAERLKKRDNGRPQQQQPRQRRVLEGTPSLPEEKRQKRWGVRDM
jgi:hypothetical protein